jgi:hypothetical protein
MASIKDVGRFFVFIVVGLITIIVGSFMIRGTMHLWDRKKEPTDKEDHNNGQNMKKSDKDDADKES